MNRRFLLKIRVLLCLSFAPLTIFAQPRFPLKVSNNGRYFVDQEGKPFLYNADTGWKMFTRLTAAEAVEYMSFRKAQGFNTIQVMLALSPDDKNLAGEKPFNGDNDFSKPNESYYKHVKEIIAKADSLGLLIALTQPWLGCCREGFGGGPDRPFQKNGPEKARKYGEYLGRKFASSKNLFWIAGGDSDPRGDRDAEFAFIEGLYKTAPEYQLITYHASSSHSSTDLFQYAPWLGFSFIYAYWREKPTSWVTADLVPHVYEAALREWSKSDRMPFVLGESQYEGTGRIANDMGTPQIIRRQAYWTMLCGGAGAAYGADIWDFPKNWREVMKYPGAVQLKHFIGFFEQIPWWTLIPDVAHQVVIAGYGDWSKPNYVTTALSEDQRLMVSYIPQMQPVTVNFGRLKGDKFLVRFYDPRSGKIAKEFTNTQKTSLRIDTPPGEDWVLWIQQK